MCNLKSQKTNAQAIIDLVAGWKRVRSRAGNQPLMPGVFPNQQGVFLRASGDDLELASGLWGMPTPAEHLVTAKGAPKSYDPGITNIRNTSAPHWQQWLGEEFRCLVPITSFAEPDQAGGTFANHWFALDDTRPLAFFAGVCAELTRKPKASGEPVEGLFYAFLTTKPNAEVAAVHPKAMPVILTTREEWQTWMTAPWPEARKLQRPLPDGALKVVRIGGKQDEDVLPGGDVGPVQETLL